MPLIAFERGILPLQPEEQEEKDGSATPEIPIDKNITLDDDSHGQPCIAASLTAELVRTIRQFRGSQKQQDAMIEKLIEDIETYLAQQSPKKPIKWLQVGALERFRDVEPVTPEPGSPLASDIIIEQRA